MELNTMFYGDEFIVYAGFVLLNNDGDTVAYEGNQAANVYGFGAQYSDQRQLYIDEFVDLPFEGTLLLVEGYFWKIIRRIALFQCLLILTGE